DRAIAIGVFEQHTLASKAIEIGRLDARIPIASEHFSAVLVSHDYQCIAARSRPLPALLRKFCIPRVHASGFYLLPFTALGWLPPSAASFRQQQQDRDPR